MAPGEHGLAMTHKTRLRKIKHLKFITIALDIKGFTKSFFCFFFKKKVIAAWFLPVL